MNIIHQILSLDNVMQFLLIALSAGATLLATSRGGWRPLAPVLGLGVQPVWIYQAAKDHSWGMYLTVALFTFIWTRDAVRSWKEWRHKLHW